METIHVRRCLYRDLPRVIELLNQLGEVSGGAVFNFETTRATYEAMQTAPDIYLNLVAEMDGRVVGFVSLIFYKTLFHSGGTALINELVIDRQQRGQGIGKILVREACEEATTRGMDELEVATERMNLDAQAFYRAAGFDEEYILFGMEFTKQ